MFQDKGVCQMYSGSTCIRGVLPLMFALVSTGTAVPVFAQDSATRDLPLCYTTGAGFTVSIQLNAAAGTLALTLEDQPPSGWAIGAVSDGGAYDAQNNKVKWGPFGDNFSRTVTYGITPPPSSSGQKCFQGGASFDGGPLVSLVGDQCIEPRDCGARVCGGDDCGGSCGSCSGGATCNNGTCVGIPAVSQWGMLALGNLFLITATLAYMRSQRLAT